MFEVCLGGFFLFFFGSEKKLLFFLGKTKNRIPFFTKEIK